MKKFNGLDMWDEIYPHISNIEKEMSSISKILKIQDKWCIVDMYFKLENNKPCIDEFRIRKVG